MRSSFLFIFLAIAVTAFSQDTLPKDTLFLKEVPVYAIADGNSPVTFQNINADFISRTSVGQEPSFILMQTPSVTAYSDAGSMQGYSYFRMRGIDQTRINVTLDGVPMNEPEDQGVYFSNFPDLLISVGEMQIQRGVGTSKNGTASFAGSLQLYSKKPLDTATTILSLGYGSYHSSRMRVEYNSGIRNGKAFSASASGIYNDGYKYHSANFGQSAFLSGMLFREKNTWRFNARIGHQQNQLAWLGVSDSLIRIDRRTNANQHETDEFTQGLIQVQHTWNDESRVVNTSVYGMALTGDYDFNLNSFLGLPSTNEMYNYAFRSGMLGGFSNISVFKNNFLYTGGIHGNIYRRSHTGSANTLGQLYTNTGYKNEVSAFSRARLSLGQFHLSGEVQLRYVTFDYSGSTQFEKMNWAFLNPSVGINYQLSAKSSLYVSAGFTGREPTRNDMFGGSDDLLADSLGNALLSATEAEYVLDQELGYRYNGSRVKLAFNLYYLDFRNELVLEGKFGPNGLPLTDQVDQSFRTGAEFHLQYRVNKNVLLSNTSSYNYSRIREATTTFAPILTPALLINQGIIYSLNRWEFGLDARYQSSSYLDFANENSIDGFFLLNAKVSYVLPRFRVAIWGNNLTNSKYYSSGYVDYDGKGKYFVQMPANFYVSVNLIL